MKLPISKSLIFSFFLIGVIAGMVLLELGVVKLPAPAPVETARLPETDKDATPLTPKYSAKAPRAKAAAVAEEQSVSTPSPTHEPIICDQDKARAIRQRAQAIALIAEQDGLLNVTFNPEWAYYSSGIKRSFIEQFAASDTCLEGQPRIIHFYFQGELVGVTDVHGGAESK